MKDSLGIKVDGFGKKIEHGKIHYGNLTKGGKK